MFFVAENYKNILINIEFLINSAMKILFILLILAFFVSAKPPSENCGLIINNVLFVLDDLISETYYMNIYYFY